MINPGKSNFPQPGDELLERSSGRKGVLCFDEKGFFVWFLDNEDRRKPLPLYRVTVHMGEVLEAFECVLN
jgi:hypothetical protein